MTRYYASGDSPIVRTWDEETEKRLHRRARRDPDARSEFLELFLVYAAQVGIKASAGRLPQDEAISAANVGLFRAFERWKPGSRSRFSTFARKFIAGAVLTEVRRQRVRSRRFINVNTQQGIQAMTDEFITLPPTPIEDLCRVAGGETLKAVMSKTLTAKERRVLRLRFTNGWTLEQIAQKEGVSRQWINEMIKHALESLRATYGTKYRRKR